MAWKRSKDGGWDYDTRIETSYQKAKRRLFGNDSPKRMLSNEELEPKLGIKEKLKQRIKEGSLRT